MHCSAGFDVAATLERLSSFVSVAVEEWGSRLATVLAFGSVDDALAGCSGCFSAEADQQPRVPQI